MHCGAASIRRLSCRRLKLDKLVCLGGFKNLRRDYAWEGFKLELDETQFDWGTVYEVEVETVRPSPVASCDWSMHAASRTQECACLQEHPEKLQQKLEDFLHSQDIGFSYSQVTKFQNFKDKTLR